MWKTSDEIRFLESIGKHREKKPANQNERTELLRSYRKAMGLRINWGTLDSDRIIDYIGDAILQNQTYPHLVTGTNRLPI